MAGGKALGLKYTLVATCVAKMWSLVMALAFMPVFMDRLGPEGFGLIGVFLTVQAVMVLLDAGISTTLSRDFSRLTGTAGKGQDYRELLRTLEAVIWCASALAAALVITVGPGLAVWGLHVESLSADTVRRSMSLMGAILFFQLPTAFYAGGLLGLQRPTLFSFLNALANTLRYAGGALALFFISATPECFFAWQLSVAAFCVLLNSIVLRWNLPAAEGRVRIRWSLLTDRWRFAAGLSGISISTLALCQIDKLVLSSTIPLKAFGYYVLAWSLANGPRQLADPVFSIFFPRLSLLLAEGDSRRVSAAYHVGCQLMTILIVPVGVTIAMFAPEVLLLWTRDPVTAEHTHVLLSLLAIGTVLNSMMVIPYALQLASGWTSLACLTNTAMALVLVPLLLLLVPAYGALAAAFLWVVLNAWYVLITIRLMHRRLLCRELWRWYAADVGCSAIPVLLILGCARLVMWDNSGGIATYAGILGALIAAQLAAAAASPLFRSRFWFPSRKLIFGDSRA